MRVWNKPELAEININETENGFFCWGTEICLLSHEHRGCNKDERKDEKDEGDQKKVINELS